MRYFFGGFIGALAVLFALDSSRETRRATK
jgi:gas vesicle protein